MNKIYLRFNLLKNKEIIEVIFDKRLSFKENFKLLSEIYPFNLKDDNYIYDLNNGIALAKDIPLSSFNFPSFINLYLL